VKNIELAKERVNVRVSEGGHNISPDVIARRYKTGLRNLFEIYLDVVDGALIFDNSEGKHELLAIKTYLRDIDVLDSVKFEELKSYENR
jgi:predicted ABC-type ATPase